MHRLATTTAPGRRRPIRLIGAVMGLLVVGIPQRSVAEPAWTTFPLNVTLSQGQSFETYITGGAMLDLDYVAPHGGEIEVRQQLKAFPPNYPTGGDTRAQPRVPTIRLPATDQPTRVSVYAGFPETLQHFGVRWLSSGQLELDDAFVFGEAPTLQTSPPGLPTLAVYGDSIAFGQGSGGTKNIAAGWADWLGRDWLVDNRAIGGTSATCWGEQHIGDLTNVGGVVIAYGTNDITGDLSGCHPTIDQFRDAIRSMLTQIHSAAQASVFVLAILPRTGTVGTQVPEWNEVLRQEATAVSATYIDPDPIMELATDFDDGLHPNLAGHEKLGAFALAAMRPGAREVLVIRAGSGLGSVSSDVAGIDCGEDCWEFFEGDPTVTLTAHRDTSSAFDGWFGDCSGLTPCQLVMDQPHSVGATFVPAVHRPDALIRAPGAPVFVGEGVHNGTGSGQTAAATTPPGRRSVFTVRVRNDGNVPGSFTVLGAPGLDGFAVRYLRGTSGTTDVTAQVENGTYEMHDLVPGTTRSLRLVVVVPHDAPPGQVGTWTVRATSVVPPGRHDVVRARVRVAAARPLSVR